MTEPRECLRDGRNIVGGLVTRRLRYPDSALVIHVNDPPRIAPGGDPEKPAICDAGRRVPPLRSRVGSIQTTEARKTPPAAGGRAGGARRRSNAGEGDAATTLWRVTPWSRDYDAGNTNSSCRPCTRHRFPQVNCTTEPPRNGSVWSQLFLVAEVRDLSEHDAYSG